MIDHFVFRLRYVCKSDDCCRALEGVQRIINHWSLATLRARQDKILAIQLELIVLEVSPFSVQLAVCHVLDRWFV